MKNIPIGHPIQNNQIPHHPVNLHHHHPPPPPQFIHHQSPYIQYIPQPTVTLNYANNCDKSTQILCQNCRTVVNTMVNAKPGKIAFVWAAILGFTCGLCCIPFFCNRCLDKHHYCPRCGI
jgi:hypothetical protein